MDVLDSARKRKSAFAAQLADLLSAKQAAQWTSACCELHEQVCAWQAECHCDGTTAVAAATFSAHHLMRLLDVLQLRSEAAQQPKAKPIRRLWVHEASDGPPRAS